MSKGLLKKFLIFTTKKQTATATTIFKTKNNSQRPSFDGVFIKNSIIFLYVLGKKPFLTQIKFKTVLKKNVNKQKLKDFSA